MRNIEYCQTDAKQNHTHLNNEEGKNKGKQCLYCLRLFPDLYMYLVQVTCVYEVPCVTFWHIQPSALIFYSYMKGGSSNLVCYHELFLFADVSTQLPCSRLDRKIHPLGECLQMIKTSPVFFFTQTKDLWCQISHRDMYLFFSFPSKKIKHCKHSRL